MSESILGEAERLVDGPRGADYGHPHEDFSRTAGIANILFSHKLREPLTASDVALFMVGLKLSREVNHPKRDNRVDGAGYLYCLDKIRDRELDAAERLG